MLERGKEADRRAPNSPHGRGKGGGGVPAVNRLYLKYYTLSYHENDIF